MYHKVKSIVKSLVPKSLLFWSEPFLRPYFLYPMYRGINYKCTVCEASLKAFITLPNGDRLCPRCGSLARDRRLSHLLNDRYLKGVSSILDFSPSRCHFRKMKKKFSDGYVSTDLSRDFIHDKEFDIRSLDVRNETFDIIICYHVLEHVIEDEKAMLELFRVLKPAGICLVQTPFKEGEIYEDYSFTSEKDRLREFGQKDHVRIYSVSGLKSRLEKSGFIVNVLNFKEKADNQLGFAAKETVLELKRPQ